MFKLSQRLHLGCFAVNFGVSLLWVLLGLGKLRCDPTLFTVPIVGWQIIVLACIAASYFLLSWTASDNVSAGQDRNLSLSWSSCTSTTILSLFNYSCRPFYASYSVYQQPANGFAEFSSFNNDISSDTEIVTKRSQHIVMGIFRNAPDTAAAIFPSSGKSFVYILPTSSLNLIDQKLHSVIS